MSSYHIGSVVSEILRYKQTDRQTSCYFIMRIIIMIDTDITTYLNSLFTKKRRFDIKNNIG